MQDMPNKKHRQKTLRQAALKKENLRLHRKIASLEVKIISLQNQHTARIEDTTLSGVSEKTLNMARKIARELQQQA